MIVADSSYIAEGVLVDRSLLEGVEMVTPDLAIYETVGAIWKHQEVLGRISDGEAYVSALSELVRANRLVALKPDHELASETFKIAVAYHVHPHDAVFVALAVITELDLKTLDASQNQIFQSEKSKRARGPAAGRTGGRRGV